mmetsp:Transcript_21596/g.36891  ORF Transcript_21596/g.36891 Transcript_21596/m.36891 type:complete len:206 (+) Transcript_21596:52-669(+)
MTDYNLVVNPHSVPSDTPGFSGASDFSVPAPVAYSQGGVSADKTYITSIVLASVSLLAFALWTFLLFVIAILDSTNPYVIWWAKLIEWLIVFYAVIKCVSSVLLIVGTIKGFRALLFLNIIYLVVILVIECIAFVVFFILMFVYNAEFVIWLFVLWGATEVLTLTTIIVFVLRLRNIIKTQFGNQDSSYEMATTGSNYDDGQYVI